MFLINITKFAIFTSFLRYAESDHDVAEPLRIDTNVKGDFMIGGLFPVHRRGVGKEACGSVIPDKGVQRLEAMLYALDRINADKENWSFTIGATILDTCSSDSEALERSLQFLSAGCGGFGNILARRVAGVVGAANSPVSEAVANICRLFKIPIVSYASTSENLDDEHKFKYFFRVVPSDKFQIQVILDILITFKWTFVSAVAALGEYGEKAIENLKDLIQNDEICFATTELLPRNATREYYDAVIVNLLKNEKARAVIVFLNEDKISQLLAASRRKRVAPGRFLWVASDGWGAKLDLVTGNVKAALGAITILPMRFPIPDFDDYFLSLKPSTNKRNPWFNEYWEKKFACSFNRTMYARHVEHGYLKTCTGEEDHRSVYAQEGLVPMVVDSVYVLAHALKSLCENSVDHCRGLWNSRHSGDHLRRQVAAVNFNSSQRNSMVINFNANKSVLVNYTIYQFRADPKSKSTYVYIPIGQWNPSTRLVLTGKPKWENEAKSSCSQTCGPGEERVRDLLQHKYCCWTCRLCSAEHFLPDGNSACTSCPEGEMPTLDRTSCEALEPEYLGKNLRSAWVLVPIIFSLLGLVATAVVLLVFFLYRNTPLIMASGRELCYVMFGGIFCCYCFTFVAIAKPSEVQCGILRMGMGLGLSICYAAILTKTNRLSRIFNRRVCSTKRPAYVTPASQLAICLCIVLIQLILSVMWLIITPPSVREKAMHSPRALIIMCGVDGTSVILGLLYNMFLILLCTVYAFKTRNLPENYNETKYISFTMYSSCIVWLTFICIYAGPWEDSTVQSTLLCMSVSISGSVTLCCLFLPKLYIVLFKPERNVKCPTASAEVKPVRFLRPPPRAGARSPSPSNTTTTMSESMSDGLAISTSSTTEAKRKNGMGI